MSLALLLVLKIVLSAGMVILITLVAERTSPRFAGVLIGLPLGVGLTLFFLGVEQGPAFASESSLWSIQGILATLAFCWCYRSSIVFIPHNLKGSLCLGCLCGLVGYFAVAATLQQVMPQNNVLRLLLVVLLLVPPTFSFRRCAQRKIDKRVTATGFMLALRAIFAALVILTVTGLAAVVGPTWSGLLAAFPTAILPSVMILHFHYGQKTIPGFFRDTPPAMLAIVVFSIAVHWTFPLFGVYLGTLVSYAAAFAYLAVYELKLKAIFDRAMDPSVSST
jgi:hypothetical protein